MNVLFCYRIVALEFICFAFIWETISAISYDKMVILHYNYKILSKRYQSQNVKTDVTPPEDKDTLRAPS